MSVVDLLFGRRLASDEQGGQKIGVLAGLPALGLDGLSSSAYGPEAALAILLPLGAIGLNYILPITGIILALLAMLYVSYRQTIAAYPVNGGSYTVAKENLGTYRANISNFCRTILREWFNVVEMHIDIGINRVVIDKAVKNTIACLAVANQLFFVIVDLAIQSSHV